MSNVIHLTDNNSTGTSIPQESILDILQIANIGRLQNAPNLLVFPHSFSDLKDGIGDLSIVTLHDAQYVDGKCVSVKACTGNLMGFVGVNETSVSIHSRFTHKKENGEVNPSSPDYFLYYMLQKVFSVNVFSLEHASSRDDKILDFLLFLFPLMLKNAMSQGLYKEYRKYLHDDDRVKGAIDVNRFIRKDIPFKGKISYTTREYSYDNTITQLVRHTIEYIKYHHFGNTILNNDSETIGYIHQIVEATPSYCLRDRQRVLNANRRPKAHPYFTKYRELQQLCVHILRHESLKYGEEKYRIHGVLFDGAWLWEEYLNKVFLEHHLAITHAKNKTGENGILLYKGGKCYYPDFYRKANADNEGMKSFVLDAKYKRLGYDVAIEEQNSQDAKNAISFCREDLFQMISYMHVLPAKHCALLYPLERKDSDTHTIVESDSRQLLGLGGEIKGFGVPILEMKTDTGEPIGYQQFCVSQDQVAKELSSQIQKWMKSGS